ncbi:hypothetical protein [Psychrobacillus lasiicapitis]|uniref:DUF3137 domain-containing protein n=1 Tax=Psychrobacillus lasiicapitis TaxID=1636719 RepID=A0A544TGS5_9BACI|nr:hypothetical protein [Psychrobacillus lasiicapitis]TQR16665.1 hypothetical protein FG382_00415 [Psychrobacillus lasiicapitis]GGA28247.1 hypothetical protein GCM10011384_17030 [Psychrobacillus lasiicapitis]
MGIYSLVDNRADHSLNIVTSDFQKYCQIENREYNNIELNGRNIGLYKLHTSYKIINKWMGRIYIFGIHGVIDSTINSRDFTISLKYRGKFKEKKPFFQSKENASFAKKFNQDTELIEICKEVDFEKLVIQYVEKRKQWTIEIWPNFGDFIWMLIPPLRYMRRPSNVEIENVNRLMKTLATITRNLKE